MPTLPKARKNTTPRRKTTESWGGDTSFYAGAKWRKLRKWWVNRNPLCVECEKKGKVVGVQVVDHIVPIKQGGAELSSDNLQSLCHSCHNRKTRLENSKKKKTEDGRKEEQI